MRRRTPTYDLPERHRGQNSTFLVYQGRKHRLVRLLGLVLIILIGVVASLLFPFGPRVSLPRLGAAAPPPRIEQLAVSGKHSGRALDVVTPIRLSWKSRPAAQTYHLQLTAAYGHPSFSHPLLSIHLTHPSYTLRLTVPGTYYWRVRGQNGSIWGPYSFAHSLQTVVTLARPVTLIPPNHAQVQGMVRFCWSPVAGAVGYTLDVTRHGVLHARGTCTWARLARGKYQWKVYPVGGNARQGPRSLTRTFTVSAPPAVHHRVKHRTAARVSTSVSPPVPTAVSQAVAPPVVVPPTPVPVVLPAPTSIPAVVPSTVPPAVQPTSAPPSPAAPAAGTSPSSGTGKKPCIPMFTC